jgi:hypothetical protein
MKAIISFVFNFRHLIEFKSTALQLFRDAWSNRNTKEKSCQQRHAVDMDTALTLLCLKARGFLAQRPHLN